MLNSQALAELNKLKQIIEDNKDSGEGYVRGSQGRYGFVNLDDGRSVYLSNDEMQRVLPGDRVAVEVITNDKKKSEAKIEKLLEKNFRNFVGTYLVKGKAHFVVPSHRETSRGLFVPPKERKNHKQGDFVYCQVSRHPFADGKSQVKILNALGTTEDKGVEHRFIEHKYNIETEFTDKEESLAAELSQLNFEDLTKHYSDLSNLAFVTIDAASTEDLDDALFCEKQDGSDNWILYSAIADPGLYIEPKSALDLQAFKRASSVYFPGKVNAMFPNALTKDVFSLKENSIRPSLVCKMTVTKEGEITEWEFIQALIKSQAKLSYDTVKQFLEAGEEADLSDSIKTNLNYLNEVALARFNYREQHNVIQQDNLDYRYYLNDKMLIESVSVHRGSTSNRIVEEAMLATNLCAGKEFASKNLSGALFTNHLGFRSERLQEIKHLLKLEKPDFDSSTIDSFEGFQQLMKSLQNEAADQQLLSTLKRLLQGASISTEASPHYGLGFENYALITSPIRRYQDLHNQRILKQSLNKESSPPKTIKAAGLQEKITSIKSSQRELIQRLLCRYLSNNIGKEFDAKIIAVSSQGLALRLADTGAESFVLIRKSADTTVKYDSIRLTLSVNDLCYKVDQAIKVKLEKVDLFKYQIELSLA